MIRPVAVALVADLGRLLLMRVEDANTRSIGYRPLGGSIEFGEYGAQTVAREFREELDATLTSIRYVGTVENLFTYRGRQEHELMLVYSGELLEVVRFRDVAENSFARRSECCRLAIDGRCARWKGYLLSRGRFDAGPDLIQRVTVGTDILEQLDGMAEDV